MDTPQPDGADLLKAAEKLFINGAIAEAESAYLSAIAANPRLTAAYLGAARCARKRGDRSSALEQFLVAARTSPAMPGPRLEAATELRALGRLNEAERLYQVVLEATPENYQAVVGLGHCARTRGDRNAALLHFMKAAQVSPALPGPRLEAATELRALGRLDEADRLYHAILEATPENVQAIIGLGHCARTRGDRNAAFIQFMKAAEVSPHLPGPRLEAATELRALGRLDEADRICKDVLEEAPKNQQALMALGYSARARGDHPGALVHFDAAAQAGPIQILPQLETARELRESGQFEAARRIILSALAKNPFHIQVMLALGYIERAAGNNNAALAAFTAAHNAHPRHVGTLVELAMEQRLLGLPDECCEHLMHALKIDPLNVPATNKLAEQLLFAEKYDQAYEVYTQAAKLQPTQLTFRLGQAASLIQMKRVDEALVFLERLERSFPATSSIRQRRISLLRQKGEYYEAHMLARSSVKAAPNSFPLWAELFLTEILIGETTDIEACLKNMPASTMRERARCEQFKAMWAESQWRIADAIYHYENAASLSTQDFALQNDLVRTKLLIMDIDGAREHLRRARDLNVSTIKLRGQTLNTSPTKYGQLINEYTLDENLATMLTDLQALAPQTRANFLIQIVRDYPDNTAPAVNLLVALRKSGMLRRKIEDQLRPIPKVIIQYWDTSSVPDDIQDLMASWRKQNQGYDIQRFDDARALTWLAEHYPSAVALAYQRSREPAQKSDIFRLAWLAREGGIYADADDRCLRPIETILPKHFNLVLYQEHVGTLGNNFIAAAPGHPVIKLALEQAVISINRGDNDGVWFCTGPALITRAFTQFLSKAGKIQMTGSAVLHERDLYQAVAVGCSAKYKNSNLHWSKMVLSRRRSGSASIKTMPIG